MAGSNESMESSVLRLFLKYNNTVYVRGHKYVLGPTQTHFKMSSEKGPKYIYDQEHKLYYY